MTTLAELHAEARTRGLAGYRRLAKAELAALLAPSGSPIPRVPVRLERDGPLALILLDDRDTRNAMTAAAIDGFGAALDSIGSDDSVALVAVMGVGPMFCSGAGLRDFEGRPDGGADLTDGGTALLARLAALPVPTVALINGHAIGGGVEVALACDWRLIDPESELRFVHASLGLIPGFGGLARLARLVGHGTALRLLAACESVDGRRAVALGLADEEIGYRDQRGRARALAARIDGSDRAAVAAIKGALADGTAAAERSAFLACWERRQQG